MKKWVLKNKYLFAIIVLSIPVIIPLVHHGFFQTDDGEWMIIRFTAFFQALREGQFPVRWLGRLNQGYGYPLGNFAYPGFMYLGSVIHSVGIGFVDTIKIILGISLISSGIFAFLWLRKWFESIPSLLGSLLYVYAPYHLFDVYTRGSVGEVLSLAVVPFILWQIERKSTWLSALGIGFLVLSHNTLAVFFAPIIFLYWIVSVKRLKLSYLAPIIGTVLGCASSAFFAIPAVIELPYTIFNTTQVSEWNKYFASNSLIGVSSLTILSVSFLVLLKTKEKKMALFFLIVGLGSAFLSSVVSTPLWQVIPTSIIQFPFRILSLLLISISFLSAFLLARMDGLQKYLIFGALLLIAVVSSYPYMQPKIYFDKGDMYYATNQATTTVKDEYMPKWLEHIPSSMSEKKVVGENAQISDEVAKSHKITFSLHAQQPTRITVNTAYFPGWRAYVDGRAVPIDYTNGLISLNAPRGNHFVEIVFGRTLVRMLSEVLSGISLCIIGIIAIWSRMNQRNRRS